MNSHNDFVIGAKYKTRSTDVVYQCVGFAVDGRAIVQNAADGTSAPSLVTVPSIWYKYTPPIVTRSFHNVYNGYIGTRGYATLREARATPEPKLGQLIYTYIDGRVTNVEFKDGDSQ